MARRLVLAVVLLVAGDARAEDEMSAFKANVEAAGWLLPTLTLHTVLHEGSHALAARSIGAQAVQIHWLPGNWALGVTGWMKRGRSEREVAFVAVAPAITNLVVLSAITILSELGIPSNEHARLPLTVMAFWAWADLAQQLIPLQSNDLEKFHRYAHLPAWQRLSLRAFHLGVVVVGYQFLRRGYDSISDELPDQPQRRLTLSFRF